jgi:hypothetical protein
MPKDSKSKNTEPKTTKVKRIKVKDLSKLPEEHLKNVKGGRLRQP